MLDKNEKIKIERLVYFIDNNSKGKSINCSIECLFGEIDEWRNFYKEKYDATQVLFVFSALVL